MTPVILSKRLLAEALTRAFARATVGNVSLDPRSPLTSSESSTCVINRPKGASTAECAGQHRVHRELWRDDGMSNQCNGAKTKIVLRRASANPEVR
jgi:hypothetical protein